MTDSIFITGATGHVGASLIPRLLEDDQTRIIALVRAKDDEHLQQRRQKLLSRLAIDEKRFIAIKGDVAEPNLGISVADQALIDSEVTSLIHSAASVRFDMPQEKAAEQNIAATQAMLTLAQSLAEKGRLKRYDHVSTCYVAGTRIGPVFENENDEGQDFRNSYEWSKCEAEKHVRTAIKAGLPAAISRPSIIVGEQESGATKSFNVIYWPMKIYTKGWWRTFPGKRTAPVDIVPVDFVTKAIVRIRAQESTLGKCFHLAVGDNAPTVSELEEVARKLTGGPPIRYIDQKLYKKYFRPLLLPLYVTKRGQAIKRGGDAFMPYFEDNPIFDRSNAKEALGDLKPPNVLEYISQTIQYALEADFQAS